MANQPFTILVSSAGRRVALIECFRRAAFQLQLALKVVACDHFPEMSAACQVADVSFKVPPVDSPDFPAAMREIAEREGAALVIPTIDTELFPLAMAAQEFNAFGCQVHVSAPDVVRIVRDKFETMRVLDLAGVPVPHTLDLVEFLAQAEGLKWPLFLKPRAGSASRLISVMRSGSDLPRDVEEPMILQDFLDGPEFTVNAFIDRDGTLKSAVTHRRLRVRAGEVEKGRTERHPVHLDIAERIVAAMPSLRSAICFQIIDDRLLGPRVIEINARFGGGYPLVDYAGATFAKWLLEEATGLPSTAHDNWREGVLMLRYDAAVFQG